MKFDLTIKDASLNEIDALVKFLSTPKKDEHVISMDGVSFAAKQNGKIREVANLGEIPTESRAEQMPHGNGGVVNIVNYAGPVQTEQEEQSSTDDVTGVFDKDGLPWDERIHSSNKKMTAKGVWTRKRGVQDSLVEQVEAELRGNAVPTYAPTPAVVVAPQPVMQQPFPQPIPQPQQVAVNPMVQTPFPQPTMVHPAPAVVPQPAMQPVPQPQQQPFPQPQPAPPAFVEDFNGLAQTLQSLFASGTTVDYMNSITKRITQAFQLQAPLGSITDIGSNPEMIRYAFQLFREDGKIA